MPFFGTLSTVVPLICVMIGAWLSFIFGKTLEASKQLKLQKGQAYADFFSAMSTAATSGSSEAARGLAANAKARVCIYGSPAVVHQLAEFERAGAIVSPGPGQAAIINLLIAMRSDMGVATRSVDADDLRLALFGTLRPQNDVALIQII